MDAERPTRRLRRPRVSAAILAFLLSLLISACAAVPPAPRRIALLAPFEGQYREIGYEALYAAQMALQDEHESQTLILPLDDGGTEQSARERARALTYDSSIVFVLALGPYATTPEVQAAFGSLPVLLVGYWPSIPAQPTVAALSADLREILPTLPDPYPETGKGITGAELLSLPQFDGWAGCTVWSSSLRADDAFRNRYAAMNQFAPPPRLIAPLTYTGTQIALKALASGASLREGVIKLQDEDISFDENGFWREAKAHQYGCGVQTS